MSSNVFLSFLKPAIKILHAKAKKVVELTKVIQGTQASPSMFSETRNHAW